MRPLLVGVALALIDIEREVIEYQWRGSWWQLREHPDLQAPQQLVFEDGRWRPFEDVVAILMTEYAAPCRVISRRAARRDPATRGQIGGDND